MVAIRYKYQLASVGRPGGADLGIELAVVVAGQGTAGFAGQPLHIAEGPVAEIAGKNMEAPVVGGADKRNALAVGREARLQVDVPARSQLLRLPALQVERAQLDGISVISCINNPAPVARPVGLVVVSRAGGQLHRGARI